MRWFVGSVASELLTMSPCPILVCRTPHPPQAACDKVGEGNRTIVNASASSGGAGVSMPLEHSHVPTDIAARIAAPNSRSYLKDGIYGAIDGAVTTFAVVSGVAGAGLSPSIVIVLGVANLVGDGFSMAAGNFLGTRAENQELEKLRAVEYKHIRECPEGERRGGASDSDPAGLFPGTARAGRRPHHVGRGCLGGNDVAA